MSIRLRTVNGIRVALCAVESDPMPGDVYLDDADHYALAAKFARDWQGQTVDWSYADEWTAMDSQKMRDVHEEHAKWDAARLATGWQGEFCKRCQHRNCIGFTVTDDVWRTVTRGRWNVLCTTCFDEVAEELGVEYRFIETWPVSWSIDTRKTVDSPDVRDLK